jgi:hypothetical protein
MAELGEQQGSAEECRRGVYSFLQDLCGAPSPEFLISNLATQPPAAFRRHLGVRVIIAGKITTARSPYASGNFEQGVRRSLSDDRKGKGMATDENCLNAYMRIGLADRPVAGCLHPGRLAQSARE